MSSKKKKNSRNEVNLHLDLPIFDQRPGVVFGIILALFFVGGVMAWIYIIFSDDASSKIILITALIVSAILLAINLFTIFRIGYDGFLKNLGSTFLIGMVLTVAGFYIGGLDILKTAEDGGRLLTAFLEFFIYIFLAALMAVVPAVLICFIVWMIMVIFGRE
ncbi:MAG TPA: hypothetical protein IAB53_02760 [Candidatus Scybalocola faecipullorum]|nr:hypothetical protein [Candidatus Scybalocola faecipullorum]